MVSPSGYLQKAAQDYFQISPNVIPNFIDIANYPFKKNNKIEIISRHDAEVVYQPRKPETGITVRPRATKNKDSHK